MNLHIDVVSLRILLCFVLFSLLDIGNNIIIIVKVIPLQARCGPEGV